MVPGDAKNPAMHDPERITQNGGLAARMKAATLPLGQ
jgi:hypothetical protein